MEKEEERLCSLGVITSWRASPTCQPRGGTGLARSTWSPSSLHWVTGHYYLQLDMITSQLEVSKSKVCIITPFILETQKHSL